MGGSELWWRRPAGRDQEEMGAGTLVLRAVCAAGSEAGGAQRKEVSLQPPKAVKKQGPSSRDLREDQDRSKGNRLTPYLLQS